MKVVEKVPTPPLRSTYPKSWLIVYIMFIKNIYMVNDSGSSRIISKLFKGGVGMTSGNLLVNASVHDHKDISIHLNHS